MIEISSTPLPEWADWQALPAEIREAILEVSGPASEDFDGSGEFWITIASTDDRFIGAHLYVMSGKTIWSWSTWVNGEFGEHGIATALWRFGLDLQEATRVRVHTCSNGGWRLVQRLRGLYKGRVQFHVKDVRATAVEASLREAIESGKAKSLAA